MKKSIKTIIENQYTLAEGPIWHKWRRSLLYVDILENKIYEYHTSKECITCIQLDDMVGAIAIIDEKTIIAAERDKITKIDLETHEKGKIMTFDVPISIRFNDGKCDEQGRLWIGTMFIDQTMKERIGQGDLYTIGLEGDLKIHRTDLTISNGIDWDLKKQCMYHIDTYTQKIDAFYYNSEDATIIYKDSKIVIPMELGAPDGMTIDEEGMLWIALWGGGSVVRANPQTGQILESIKIPDINVSSCTFGGEHLDILYITTAADDEGNKGGLYSVKTNTRGKQPNLCRGEWLACQKER